VCELDVSRYARIPNPYFINRFSEIAPTTPAEHTFHQAAFVPRASYDLIMVTNDMRTVTGAQEERERAAAEVRDAMVQAGYAGVITEYHGECVTYQLDTIVRVMKYRGQRPGVTDGTKVRG
jgi:hypothetical protein